MSANDSAKTVVVLGAGAIGVCSALMLQQRGYAVVLIDRKLPASETSGGNAGIIGDSAAVPFNNPGLRRELGHLLFGKSAALRYDWHYVSARMPWLVRFFCPYQRRFRETSHFIAPSINMSLSNIAPAVDDDLSIGRTIAQKRLA